jgi:hypothetical protein
MNHLASIPGYFGCDFSRKLEKIFATKGIFWCFVHFLCIFRGGLPAVKCGRKSDYGGSSVPARNRECDGAFLAH